MIWVKMAHQETKEGYGDIRLTRYLQSQQDDIRQYPKCAIKKFNQLYCKRHKRFKRKTVLKGLYTKWEIG